VPPLALVLVVLVPVVLVLAVVVDVLAVLAVLAVVAGVVLLLLEALDAPPELEELLLLPHAASPPASAAVAKTTRPYRQILLVNETPFVRTESGTINSASVYGQFCLTRSSPKCGEQS